MGNFRSDNREGFGDRGRSRSGYGGGRFGGRGGFRDRDSGRSNRRPLEMHEATCDKCGKKCEVPFKPTSGKPLYCRDCFNKNEGSGGRNQDRAPQSGMPSDQLNKINAKLDKILQVLESLELDKEEEEEEKKKDDSK